MTTTNYSAQIAETILAQLGGRRFLVMTGAKHLMYGERSLHMTLPSRFAKDGINKVKVVLEANDTYTITFGKIRGINYKEVKVIEGLYFDMLQSTFTEVTGLHTRL